MTRVQKHHGESPGLRGLLLLMQSQEAIIKTATIFAAGTWLAAGITGCGLGSKARHMAKAIA